MNDEVIHRPSTASIDRRVERLEQGLADTQRTVDRLEVGVANMKEVMGLRFTAIEGAIAASDLRVASLHEKFDKLDTFIQNAISEGAKASGDIDSTPAGRLVNKEIEELKRGRVENAEHIQKLELRVYGASAVVATLVILVNLFAIPIRHALGLP